MNRERGLLERAMNRIDFRYAQDEAIALHKEIREYLDKPEQEPVAWMYDWNIIEEEEYGETRYDNLTRAESITKSRAITNVRPLYRSPPKREPIDAFKAVQEFEGNYIYKDGFIDGIKYAEKAHGIGVDDE